MRGRVRIAVASALVAGAAVAGTVALADGGNGIREELTGYEEDPLTLSTPASGDFHASIQVKRDAIWYRLSYSGFATDVQQAHIHFGGRHQSGGVSVFLCTNLGNGPAGTQACPSREGTIKGVIKPADVIGPAEQGIAAGEFGELLDAIDAGVTYVNVHSVQHPGGEIRAQLEPRHDG
ncbi:MAG TPA: CHRD domain-containing protein [Miltoncostaeaceae bacterium]|nr:CHRD domain-containing protein [Miltoncostaeaceae bacterium]